MALNLQVKIDNSPEQIAIDIERQIDIKPLADEEDEDEETGERGQEAEDLAKIVSDLISNKNKLQKDIYNMQRLIRENTQSIKEIEKALWKKCDHEWIYDEWANFDDRTKYLCKICGCYRNSYWYN